MSLSKVSYHGGCKVKKTGVGVNLTKGILVLIFCVVIHACGSEKPRKVEKGIINSNTTWQKEILIAGDVEIARGATLTIMPGTIVKFAKIEADGPANLYDDKTNYFSRAELIVKGKLSAKGSKDNKIVFTSAERSPRPGDWGAINFNDSTDHLLAYCDISYADTGIHGHGAQVKVGNSYLHHNGVGIALKNLAKLRTQSTMSLVQNQIIGNGGGILCGAGSRCSISHNQISNNKLYGIYGKMASSSQVKYNNIMYNGKGIILYATQGFQLADNNISDNEEYNVSLLEGQRWNVDARHNWWGTKDESRIKDLIWDRDKDGTLGKVDFSDLAVSRIQEAGVAG